MIPYSGRAALFFGICPEDIFITHGKPSFACTMANDAGCSTIRDMVFNEKISPEHPAIESPGYQSLTYHKLRHQVISMVRTLNARGYRRNDRISVIMPASPEAAVMILSVMAGFTSIPLNPHAQRAEFGAWFSQIGIKAIIVRRESKTAAVMAAGQNDVAVLELEPADGDAGNFGLKPEGGGSAGEAVFAEPSDTACVFLTSGTTARPKVIPVTQKQFILTRKNQCRIFGITEDDRYLHTVPLYQSMGIGHFLNPLCCGGTVICPRDFIPSDFLPLLRTYRPTYYSAVPALHQAILGRIRRIPADELKNHSLRFIRSGADTLPENVRRELETLLGVPVIENLGTSETAIISVNLPPKPGSVGIPVIEHLEIIDENGTILGPGSEGEIIVKGETVFTGYENAPEETRAAFINGWYRTGDIGYLDPEGYLFLTGRKRELINKGGRKIAPAEIDTVLLSHPGVRDAMTFKVSDPMLGEDIEAMVVLSDPVLTEHALKHFLLDHLVNFKVPRRIHVVPAVPRNPAGKPLREAGTRRYGRQQGDGLV